MPHAAYLLDARIIWYIAAFKPECFYRFGDYVSDQVVAPVRETCAQVMGAVMKHMPPPLVHESLSILLQMQVGCRIMVYVMDFSMFEVVRDICQSKSSIITAL